MTSSSNDFTAKQIQEAIEMVEGIYFDPSDCRNIVIPCGELGASAITLDIIVDAMKHYKTMKHMKRMDEFT